MMIRYIIALTAALSVLFSHAQAAEKVLISSISKEKIGELVLVNGTTDDFKASKSEKAPNSFMLKDASGTIRVAIWPDQFDKILQKDLISKGTQVSMEAEVAEFRGKLELHVPDSAQVKVGVSGSGQTAGSLSTTASAATTTTSK